VATNQPDVAKGRMSEPELAAVHRRLEVALGAHGAWLDGIAVCVHHPDRGFPGEVAHLKGPCACRKPGDGLIRELAARLPVDLGRSVFVGDSWRDVGAARKAGLTAVGVGAGPFPEPPDWTVPDFAAAVDRLLGAGSPA
jgi:histidinol-phosphate phosphatase family protein